MGTRWLSGGIRRLATLFAVILLVAVSRSPAQAQQTVTVTTTVPTKDGDTSSVAALSAAPGPDGKISLAEAIAAVDNTGPGFTIAFNLPPGSVIETGTTYTLSAPNTTIDGDEDGDGRPDIAVIAVNGGSWGVPLSIQADHIAIRHLSTANLSLTSPAAHDCEVTDCYLGVNVDGKSRLPQFGDGLEIRLGAHNNTVARCIIAGNIAAPNDSGAVGLLIWNGAHDNTVQSCRIGVDIDGNAQPNEIGLSVGTNTTAAPHNLIGGYQTGGNSLGNVISGNNLNGLEVVGPGTTGNTVLGNLIGLDPTGTKAVPNGGPGKFTAFFIGRGAADNTIGGIRTSPTEGSGNIISGNTGVGLRLRQAGTSGNVVQGNLIGTDISGTVFLPNGDAGVQIQDGASDNTIGTSSPTDLYPTAGNVIAGNNGPGVRVMDATAVGNTIRGNEIHDNAGLGIDLAGNDRALGDYVTPNDETDADTGPNNLMNFPVGLTSWSHNGVTVISGILQTASPTTATVDIYQNSRVDPSGFGEGERYLGSATPTASGTFLLQYLGVPHPFLSATATDALGSTSEFSPVYGDPDGDGNPDSDGDGLPDDWETKGIDFDGDGVADLDLRALGASPMHKDVFVEIDYMVADDHTHKPGMLPIGGVATTDDPLAEVQAAFLLAPVQNPDGDTGIELHNMLDEAIPEVTPIYFTTKGPFPADDFDDLKWGNPPGPTNGHFGTAADRASPDAWKIIGAKRLAFHYCIFGHNFVEGGGNGGIAELPGNDFMVSLAVREPGPDNDWLDECTRVALGWGTSLDKEWSDLVAEVYMHELGHTLGLHHGGGLGIPDNQAADREVNYKPNYISVMNYGRTFNRSGPAAGLPGIKDGTLVRLNRALDYSRAALPNLLESRLDEPDGVGGPPGERIFYGYLGEGHIGPASGPVDWNDNGATTDLGVQADANFISGMEGSDPAPGQVLRGHDDWSNLVYNFRVSDDFSDAPKRTTVVVNEQDYRDYLIACLGGTRARVALMFAGGLLPASSTDLTTLDAVPGGTSTGRIDVLDAVRLARRLAGLDP